MPKKTHIQTGRNLEIQIENYQEEKVIWRKISVYKVTNTRDTN